MKNLSQKLLLTFALASAIPVSANDTRRARVRTGGYILLAPGDPCWRYLTPHGYIEECPYYRDYAYYYSPKTYYANWWVGHHLGRPYYGGYRRKAHRTHYHSGLRPHVHHNGGLRSSPPAQHGNRRISQSHVGAGYGVQGMIGTH
jgi:hypothetical protein